MSTLIKETQATKVWFDNDNLWLLLSDGRQMSTPLSYFPRLLKANEKERNNYIISGGGTGLHWDALDEDISVANLILGIGDQTSD
jgi:Protein of unknown function (DUF2442)